MTIGLPFDGADLERGSPFWGLMFASLAGPDILIDGYAQTGNRAWLDLAERMIVSFARYERSRWLDKGLMWNDHAISARIPVLVKFWAAYRERQLRDPATVNAVLQLVSRSALMLGKADAYAWQTSHGIISDLALLQIAAAFPFLPESAAARATASRRLAEHIKYWINGEGVTLLHSAGYHTGSLYHLSLALRLTTLSGGQIPQDWWMRFDRAIEHEAMLRRPDGSLPLFGDTLNLSGQAAPRVTSRTGDGAAMPLSPLVAASPATASAFLPAAGYAIWRDGGGHQPANGGSHTVMVWANHEGLGHKLADELSVLLWSVGQTWITNVGYWPYGADGREAAESWAGSNAPHLTNEPTRSSRSASALATGEASGLRFIEAQRRGPDGFNARRQLIRVEQIDAWLVLDHVTDRDNRTAQTIWTYFPDLRVQPLPGGSSYLATAPAAALDASAAAASLIASFVSSTGNQPEVHRGGRSPFAGWVVVERTPAPATAVVVRQPSADSWSLAAFSRLNPSTSTSRSPDLQMKSWKGPNEWSATWQLPDGALTIVRTPTSIAVSGLATAQATLQPAADTAEAASESRQYFLAAQNTYKRFREVVVYRERISRWLTAILAAAALALVGVRIATPRYWRPAQATLAVGWLVAGLWLGLGYFG